ncbi:MAG TPA: class I tRNA ligase family protein, partial [Verrucomicrobiae bacterium]
VYHDVIKDRLYTDAANSPRRRSTQTALHRLVTGLCQMLAPILAFTADEAWEFVPGKNVNSVHESEFKPVNFSISEYEQIQWNELFKLRAEVFPSLEEKRKEKLIGKSLDAKLVISGETDTSVEIAKQKLEELRELLNISQLEIHSRGLPLGDSRDYSITKANGQKCERCWHWEMDIGQNAEQPTICGRCIEAVKQFKP